MGANDFVDKESGGKQRAPPYGLPTFKQWQDGYLAVVQEVRGQGWGCLLHWGEGRAGHHQAHSNLDLGVVEVSFRVLGRELRQWLTCQVACWLSAVVVGDTRQAAWRWCRLLLTRLQANPKPDCGIHIHPPLPSSCPSTCSQLRRVYPTAAIVNLVWPMEQLFSGTSGVLTRDQAQRYQQWMAAAFSRLQAAGVGNVHLLQVGKLGLVQAGCPTQTIVPKLQAGEPAAQKLVW